MINKFLNSHFFYRLNKRIPLVELYKFHKVQNSPQKKWFQKKLVLFKRKISLKKSDGILLVQMVADYEYTLKLAAASKVYAEKANLDIHFYNPYWMKWIGWGNRIEELYLRILNTSLIKMYKSFGNSILFDSEVKFGNQEKIQSKFKEIRNGIHVSDDIVKIKIDGILIGDLINDTYLRFFNKPMIENLDDKELDTIIEIALNVFYSFQELLEKKPVKALFTTYTTYIGHGIVVRLCLEREIPVYAFGIYDDIFQKVDKEYPVQTLHYWKYDPYKDIDPEKLLEAERRFTSRFTGELDPAIAYMRQSAFQDKPIDDELRRKFSQKKRNVIIYTHDLYDSPHVYRHLQFSNLYLYIKQTLENVVMSEDTTFWVKVHPNSRTETKDVIRDLVNSFQNDRIVLLDESVSNIQIVNLKPDLIVTARGTIALEMAYFEIPVVALYDNPYIQFNFAHSCFDLETYYSIIRGEIEPKVDFTKEFIYRYYYQAYMENLEDVDIDIFNKLQTFKEGTYSDKYITMLKDNESLIFSDKFIANYKRKFDKHF